LTDGSAWPEDVLAALGEWRQGDIVSGVTFTYWGAEKGGLPLHPGDSVSQTADTVRELGVLGYEWDQAGLAVITSHTCDIDEDGEPLQPWIQVCPLRQLPDVDEDKTLPEFLYRVQPPDLEPAHWAIDLRIEAAVEKTALVGQARRSAFANEKDAIAFSEHLGRRRDRAALADTLVRTVTGSLRQERRKRGSFKKALRQEIHSVHLRIEEGTRAKPVAVQVHVITHEAPSERVRRVFDQWWDRAREQAAAEQITLLPTVFHDGNAVPITTYDALIRLELG
jgi:hypothetical protein